MNALKTTCFIGMDQTGAVSQSGLLAKPLPLCIGIKNQKGLQVFTSSKAGRPLLLSQFNPAKIKNLFDQMRLSWIPSQTVFAIDCVLGLPNAPLLQKGMPYLWGYFREAAGFNFRGKEFGREVAEAFFDRGIPKNREKDFPRRLCEQISGSNSVFQKRPYQKNIQTGTFRIWKDLGRSQNQWAHIWPFDLKTKNQKKPWIFEGYPSLIWKDWLGSRTRDLTQLRKLVKKLPLDIKLDTWKWIETDPNQADAFVLMLGAVLLERREKLWLPHPAFLKTKEAFREGWMMGLQTLNLD